ncbi:Uncharacterised protein [Vibrio cholerae]|nr:Uncharacterised protein [Vibrio cholerae]
MELSDLEAFYRESSPIQDSCRRHCTFGGFAG